MPQISQKYFLFLELKWLNSCNFFMSQTSVVWICAVVSVFSQIQYAFSLIDTLRFVLQFIIILF